MATQFKKRLRKAAFKKPEITVKMILPGGLSTRGSTVNLWVKVFNPNPYALDVISLAYKVCKLSDQTKIADGAITESFKIPSKESVDAKMDVTFTFSGVTSVGKSFAVRGGRMRYLVSGTLTVKKFLAPIVIPFEKEKEISLFERSESKDVEALKERNGSKETRIRKQDSVHFGDSLKNQTEGSKTGRLKQSSGPSTQKSSNAAKPGEESQRWRPRKIASFQENLTAQSSNESKERSGGDTQRWRPRKLPDSGGERIVYF